MNTRIVELVIDENLDEFGGIDGVALVARPAHEENWMAFNSTDTCCETELKNIFEVLDEDKMTELGKILGELGEPSGTLEAEGYELVGIKPIRDKHSFNVGGYAKPNEKSGEDSIGQRIRYKYVGPRDKKNRTFCEQMMTANRVYRIEDIQQMTADQANAEFGYYDIFQWRGSFNCRHFWVQLTYQPTGTILNKSSVRKGLIGEEIYQPQAETITNKTANAWEREGKSTEIYNPNRFTEMEFETYTDYPKAASENACKVLRWIEEYGRDVVDAMTQTGLARANQLCNGEGISRDTIARMASFNRHRQNAEINPDFKGEPWKDKGYVSWLGWGGTEGVDWAMKKLEQIDTEMGLEDACWPGYEAVGLKEKDGRLVPNCVPIKMEIDTQGLTPYVDEIKKKPIITQNFSMDDDKMEITGAAIVPNKFIIRVNEFNQPYYVFFSKETTKQLAQKFMKDNINNSTNIEHTDISAKAFVSESWIVEDTEIDKSKVLGLEYPEGTWVITMKVQDPKLWKDIKAGKYKGFSVEGFFNEKLIFKDKGNKQK